MAQRRVFLDGLVFPEAPRWHAGALWFSDIHDHKVHRVSVDAAGDACEDTVIAQFDDLPSGLGFLDDGSLLVVLMQSQRIARVAPDGTITRHADCSPWCRGTLNDMIVARSGTAYAGDMGMRLFGDQPPTMRLGQLFEISSVGGVRCASDGMSAPNGIALNEDETQLFVAESGGARVVQFDIRDDAVVDRREFAPLDPAQDAAVAAPDGICCDAAGAVWVADPMGGRVVRLLPGSRPPQILGFPGALPVAVVLGGTDRRTLFVCVADDWHPEGVLARRSGRIEAIGVEVGGAGRP